MQEAVVVQVIVDVRDENGEGDAAPQLLDVQRWGRAPSIFARTAEDARLVVEAERTDPAEVIDFEQKIHRRGERGVRLAGGLGQGTALPVIAQDDLGCPAVRLGVGDGAREDRPALAPLVELRTGDQRHRWVDAEAIGRREPLGIVLERRAFARAIPVIPQDAHPPDADAEGYPDGAFHLGCGSRLGRTRLGRCSDSSSVPVSSARGSARSATGVPSPRTNNAIMYVPMATLGSPFSRRSYVVRAMPSRSAIMTVVMPRRRRPTEMSAPNLTRARRTGLGSVSLVADFIAPHICSII